jgi:hypothetical protein
MQRTFLYSSNRYKPQTKAFTAFSRNLKSVTGLLRPKSLRTPALEKYILYKEAQIRMFTEPLLVTEKSGMNLCVITEQLHKLKYNHTMESYTLFKKNEGALHALT